MGVCCWEKYIIVDISLTKYTYGANKKSKNSYNIRHEIVETNQEENFSGAVPCVYHDGMIVSFEANWQVTWKKISFS